MAGSAGGAGIQLAAFPADGRPPHHGGAAASLASAPRPAGRGAKHLYTSQCTAYADATTAVTMRLTAARRSELTCTAMALSG